MTDVLDLTFLASGYRQHAFTPTGRPDDAWVYKIPADFGRVLPYRHRVGTVPAPTWGKRALQRLVNTLTRLRVVWLRDWLLTTYFRVKYRRDFGAMLSLLQELHRRGAADALVPYRVLRGARAVLRVDGRTLPYRGPMLAQRRVALAAFVAAEPLDATAIVAAQYHLWHQGFALTEPGEILGTRSWALVDGRPLLADTSSLTRRHDLARRCLDARILDRRETEMRRRLAEAGRPSSHDAFFRTMRAGVTVQRLDQLWAKETLTRRAVSGMLWTALGKSAHAILQVIVVAILARLLTPADFGVIGAALIVIGFSHILSHVGLGPALVQRPALEPRHVRTAFAGAAMLGLLLGLGIWFAAPLAAGFFRVESVTPVLRALAWVFPIRGLGVVAESLMERDLRFRWLATLDVASFGLGYGLLGIVLALFGWGVWALVGGQMAQVLIKTGALLLARPPLVGRPERRALGELLYFGGGFTLARVANYIAHQADNIVVGRLLGPEALGLYGRAYQLMSLPATQFGQVLDTVLFPTMARVQSDPERLTTAYTRGIALVALLVLPASAMLFVLAPEVVLALLGPQWGAAVLPFQILLVGMLFRTSAKLSDSLARATGAVYRRAWRQAIYAALVIAGAGGGARWGLGGVAAGVLAALTVNCILMAQLSVSLGRMTWGRVARAHVPALHLTVLAGLVAWALATLMRAVNAGAVLVLVVTFAVTGAALLGSIRFVPSRFLGTHGLLMLDVLATYLPAAVRRWVGRGGEARYAGAAEAAG